MTMASHYFAVIFIVSAMFYVSGTDAGRFCPPPLCRCRRPFCRPPNPSETLKSDEVKPHSIQTPLSSKWLQDWDPPTPTKPSGPAEEPAPPNSDLVTSPKKPGLQYWEPGTPHKQTPHIAEEPAVPNSPLKQTPHTDEVKPHSIQTPLSSKWLQDWDPPTPKKPSGPAEEPAPPNSDLVTSPKKPGLQYWEPGTPPKQTPHIAEEPAVPSSPRYAP
ncbi:vegetative cell wall protein gp1-like [Eucalyptus grandis]|uniref:vegetative cell wall protein gp1-like n=1 Tax=Eucalyptus grandis TaxID=71139 RepID=UPI00192ED09A|nr:vegetative cell wall protein gp1-like [Eucalyptus grandis]